MSLTEDLAAVTTAADDLTQTVADKISLIDQRVEQFQQDATQVVAGATGQLKRTHIGIEQGPSTIVTPTPEDDTGLLVQQAFSNGAKHVRVDWEADGKERHWNTKVSMPVGTTLSVTGPDSRVLTLGGNPRSDRACYSRGRHGGTSIHGSPMIFRNLHPSSANYPFGDYFKVLDSISLIEMNGNNTVVWGDGTYLHDIGGMVAGPGSAGLLEVEAYTYGLPCFVLGGGHGCQFYLGGSLINQNGGTATCEVRIMEGSFHKVDNDGPALTADKGFKRLLDKGVAGVTPDLLSAQPYTITAEQAALNDSLHPGFSNNFFAVTRGTEAGDPRPRIVTGLTWSHQSGWVHIQSTRGFGEMSTSGLLHTEGSNTYKGER